LYDFNVKTIYDIEQDENGSFWFGTDRGIVRFDGKNLKTFHHHKFDKEYTRIKFDEMGTPYFVNFGGQLFRLKNDSVEVVVEYTLEDNFIKDYVFKGEDIYYHTLRGKIIYQHSPSNKIDQVLVKYERRTVEEIFLEGKELCFYTQKGDSVGRLTNISKWKLDLLNHTKHQLQHSVNVKSESAVNRFIYTDKTDLYFQFFNELSVYDLKAENDEMINDKTFTVAEINDVYQNKNDIYILGKVAIHKLNVSDIKNIHNKLWMDDVNATCMFIDHEKNRWIGTTDKGIRIVPAEKVVQSNLNQFEIRVSEMDITRDIYYSDAKGDVFITSPPYQTSKLIMEGGVPGNEIGINEYTGEVYFSSINMYYDLINKKLKKRELNEFFKSIQFLGEKSNIKTGSPKTYFYGDISQIPFRFPELKKGPGNENDVPYYLLTTGRSNLVFVDSHREYMYLDRIEGLTIYSKDKDPFTPYLKGEPVLVSAMEPDRSTGVYVTTKNAELIYFKDGVYQMHIELNEQADVICLAKEYVFLKGNEGIYRYNLKTKELTLINFIDGVETADVVDMYFHSDSIYVVGGYGVTKFPYDYGVVNQVAPILTLNKIELFDRPIEDGRTNFNHNDNQITFKFQAIAVRSQKTLTYHYQLNNQGWQQTSWDVPFVRYGQLAPGSYEFRVKACNEDGVCSEEITYAFRIKPHFASTWWFISLVGLLIALVIVLVVVFRLKNIRKENALLNKQEELKKEVYKSKITAIRSQMNPHFMFNALNTIQDYIISNEKIIASEFLADFADLMRLYLNQSKQDFITIEDEVRTIELYLRLEKSRFGDDFTYDIVVNDNVDVGNVEIPIMMLQPLIENAIKHGLLHKDGKKQLTISFAFEKNSLRLEVADNGIGFENSIKMKSNNSAHESFATNAMQEKISLLRLHYQIDIDFQVNHLKNEDGTSGGTSVVLIF
jgi:hypothetical protein